MLLHSSNHKGINALGNKSDSYFFIITNCNIFTTSFIAFMNIFSYLIFLIFTKSFIAATNYYVAVSYGEDTNNGLSINAPFKTILHIKA